MSEPGLQHIQLPNDMTKDKKLTPNDLWVYICIKSFLNGKTKECYPSLKKISEKSSLSIPTIRISIDALEAENWISVKKVGRAQRYYFTPYKNFEICSVSFLNKKDISVKEKAYLMASQQFMYKDVKGYGKISYFNEDLAERINLSETKIAKYDQSLIDKGYLSLVRSGAKDLESGIYLNQKFFKLDELGQAIVFTLGKHEKEIKEHDILLSEHQEKIDTYEKSASWLLEKVLSQEKELEELRKLVNNKNEQIINL